MRTRHIGSLEVSAIGLGCNNFGARLDERQTADVVHAALDAGITFFDTSDNYGNCRSEVLLGRALGARRSEIVLATKFGQVLPGVEGSGGASPRWVRTAVEASLRRLGTDHIDLYQQHFPDPGVPIEETLGTLAELVAEGKVREVGSSNVTPAQMEEADQAAGAGAGPRYVSTQAEYSLVHRRPERDGVAEACVRLGVRLLPYFPLASGLLTGKHTLEHQSGRLLLERYRRYVTEENFAAVDRLRDHAAGTGKSMLDLALGWLLAKPSVGAVLVGASTPEQVVANTAAADTVLGNEEVAALDAMALDAAGAGA